jgi:hypothetical protein
MTSLPFAPEGSCSLVLILCSRCLETHKVTSVKCLYMKRLIQADALRIGLYLHVMLHAAIKGVHRCLLRGNCIGGVLFVLLLNWGRRRLHNGIEERASSTEPLVTGRQTHPHKLQQFAFLQVIHIHKI